MMTPEDFMELMKADEELSFKFGVIDSIEDGKAHILFDGEDIPSGKAYLGVNYNPVVWDDVMLLKVKGTYVILGKIGELVVTKEELGLENVDNKKQMPLSGDTFTGIAKAQNNTSYEVKQVRNIIISPSNADVNLMENGDIWLKYE